MRAKKILPPVSSKVDPNTKTKPTKKAKEVEDNHYKKDFEFVKAHSENDPLSPWERRMQSGDWKHVYKVPTINTMLEKQHHTFGHEKSQMNGFLRMSGHEKAHQIGKRKAK